MQIREVVKREFFQQTDKTTISRKIEAIIKRAQAGIKLPVLRDAAKRSLFRFYERQYNELKRSFSWQISVLTAFSILSGKTLTGKVIKPTAAQKQNAIETLNGIGYDASKLLGVPLNKFSEEYYKKNVLPAIIRLAEIHAKDPDDVSSRNSLRNRAEMEVRYASHLEQIESFKQNGVNLVIASTHSDCSERCAPWQGRVYSLDGTSGITDDGRRFIPLENATDIWYTTKAGKRYKNGLLGFNCRHYLIAYQSGYRFPNPDPKTEKKQYAITERQRELERLVRKWKIIAVEAKGQYEKLYQKAKVMAKRWEKEYINFSLENNRAYYKSRLSI